MQLCLKMQAWMALPTHLYPQNSLVVGARRRGMAAARGRESVFVCEGDIEFVSTNTYWQSIDPEGKFSFPFSLLDGWRTAVLEKGGREGEKKCCLPPTFPSITLLKRIRYFVLRWIDFQAFGSSSREKQILRDKLGIASKLSFRIFFFFRFNPCYFVL